MWIFILVIGLLVTAGFVMIVVGILISAPRYRGPVSDHFDGSKFINPGGAKAKGPREVLKWMMNRKQGPWHEVTGERFGKHPLAHFKGGIRVTFVNHSTFLIQVDGLNILTDPVWSRRVSPFTWIGPKRMAPPGIRFGDLPKIDVVLLTHNHYDHLDIATMRMVFGAHHPAIVVPLGVKKFLDQHYVSGAVELDWWQRVDLKDIGFQAVPSQHFSGRGLLDRDATLWCGFVINAREGNVYFAGDTAYNKAMFEKIASTSGPFKISMLPIGAYKPEWFMSPVHISPEDAVRMHLDIGSSVSIAMHHGTFPLADEGSKEPAEDLQLAMQKYGLAEDQFIILDAGDVKVFE